MSSDNGLIGSSAYRKPGVPYYMQEGAEVVLRQPTLVAPITLESFDEAAQAIMTVRGLTAGVPVPYTGGVSINPGASSLGTAPAGLNIHSIANGVAVEVGTDTATANTLSIAGPAGLARVYDETYNQPVALQPITMVSVNPLCAPAAGNTSEIFRCGQAAVAAADSGLGQANQFRVPKTGFYALQMEVSLFNGPAPAPPAINVPAIVSGGIDVYGSMELTIAESAVVIPYGTREIVGGSIFSSDCLLADNGFDSTFQALYLLDATKTYVFVLSVSRPAGSSAWNIGPNGQIKAELIAMC